MENLVGKDELILVAGGGGFIGGHMIKRLREMGYRRLRSADIKPTGLWHQAFDGVENLTLDLKDPEASRIATKGAAWVFDFAADMGGMGFIETHKADCMLSVLINTHLLLGAREAGCRRYYYASSACVYAADKQTATENPGLKEADAYPAMPEDGYGWEKLFSERMCRHFREDYGLDTRVGRYHNVYGPLGTYDGGREKAPAAISRKVIQALREGRDEIEIWGDGRQTRSFMYIDDCLDGTLRLMASDVTDPLNIGSAEMVTVNQLVDIVEGLAGIKLRRRHKLDAPLGVRGRSSDNSLVRKLLGWEPTMPLAEGMEETYRWIAEEMAAPPEKRRRAFTAG